MSIADTQHARGTSSTISVTLTNSAGEPAAAAGAVTVTVTAADGTAVVTAQAASSGASTGVYTYTLTPTQTASLGLLTAVWTDAGDSSSHTSRHEIVGGYFFTVAEARATEPSLADATKYPEATVQAVRRDVEDEFEEICGVAFVPRYERLHLSGTGRALLATGKRELRTVRSVRVYTDLGAGTYTALTAPQLAALATDEAGNIRRTDGGVFTAGHDNIVIELEHGYDRPPPRVKRAALTRLRHALNAGKSGIPDRAASVVLDNGVVYRLERADARRTGIPDVDSVLARYIVPGLG